MTDTGFIETPECRDLRMAVAVAADYGQDYYVAKARAGEHTTELWNEASRFPRPPPSTSVWRRSREAREGMLAFLQKRRPVWADSAEHGND